MAHDDRGAFRGDPAPAHAFALRLDREIALRLRERHHAGDLYDRVDRERERLAEAFTWARGLTPADAERRVGEGLDQFRRGAGWHADLCWRREVVGALWLHHLDGVGGSTEVGFWLAREREGRGLAGRALGGLLRHFFEGRGLERVAIAVVPGRGRSEAVARRLGFELEAVLRRAHLAPDGPADLAFWGRMRADWQAAGGAGEGAAPLPLPRFALRVDDELAIALLERADAEALHRLVDAERERLARWLPWARQQSFDGTVRFIEGRVLGAIADADGFEAGVWLRGRLVGMVGIHDVRPGTRSGSIGYWLASEAEGAGVMTRAVRAVIAKAFGDLGFERLDIRADPRNVRSRAVPERLGFAFEGVLRLDAALAEGFGDHVVYGLLRSEWRG